MPKSSSSERAELAAFTTHSKTSKDKPQRRRQQEQGSASRAMVPFMERLEGFDDIELCGDGAELEQHVKDTERLVSTLEAAVNGHDSLLAKAITREKRAAVESATEAAVIATERRCAEEKRAAVREAVREAVQEARAAAKKAQAAAVAEAVKQTEERCAELQRLAVQSVTSQMQRAIGQSEDVVLATQAASSFEEAAASAGAALAAASSLLGRSVDSEVDSEPQAAGGAKVQEKKEEEDPEGLHFF